MYKLAKASKLSKVTNGFFIAPFLSIYFSVDFVNILKKNLTALDKADKAIFIAAGGSPLGLGADRSGSILL